MDNSEEMLGRDEGKEERGKGKRKAKKKEMGENRELKQVV